MQQPDLATLLPFGIHLYACTDFRFYTDVVKPMKAGARVHYFSTLPVLESALDGLSLMTVPEVLLVQVMGETDFEDIERIRAQRVMRDVIVILFTRHEDPAWEARARAMRIQDYYVGNVGASELAARIAFLVKWRSVRPGLDAVMQQSAEEPYVGTPVMKRFFDMLFAGVLIILLSPIMLIAALAIKLEDGGPVIYRSKRVGNGYKVFDFYKFRSMRIDAEKRLAELARKNNQYSENGDVNGETTGHAAPAFVKLKNDPRVTRIGRFIRKTSIDELPQLFNILIGDMSTVGNRPLPLYEAELLTADEWSWRFLAPAGLTGLWQVSRRGGSEMDEQERKELDNYYAKNHSMALDAKILVRTFSAIIQKENV